MTERKQKTLEEVRVAARDRKRAQRERDALAEDELRFRTMDPGEARVVEIMGTIAQETRKPQPPRVPQPPEPARLPSLALQLKFLQSGPQTHAIEKAIARLEAAIQSGQVEPPSLDEQIAENQRKSAEQSKRSLWSSYFDGIPVKEVKDATA